MGQKNVTSVLRTTTMTTSQTLSSSITASTTTQVVQNKPPIANLLPILLKTATFVAAFLSKSSHVARSIVAWAAYPLLVLMKAQLPLILYILSPIIVFGQIILGLFFVIPYHILVDFFVAVQPFYVFCGIACITGAVVGLGGRFLAAMFNVIIEGPGETEKPADDEVPLDEKPKQQIKSEDGR